MATKSHDIIVKVLLVGESGAGKTAIITRFSDDTFSTSYLSTIGVDFKVRTIDVNGVKISMQLWDTAGQERFRTVTASYYRGAHAILVVYDLTDAESFRGVKRWFSEVATYLPGCGFNAEGYVDTPGQRRVDVALVANKLDLACDTDLAKSKRIVDTELGQELADKYRVPFFEVSACTDLNVTDLITHTGTLAAMRLKPEMFAVGANLAKLRSQTATPVNVTLTQKQPEENCTC